MRNALTAAALALLVLPLAAFGECPFEDGDTAPDFTVESLDREMVSLSDHLGKIVVIDFFMYNCPPCHAAVPELEADVWQVYKDRGVLVWGVDVDPGRDSFEIIEQFRDMYGLTYPLAFDVDLDAWSQYASGGVPTMYIVDPVGVIRYSEIGFNKTKVIKKIEELLLETPTELTFELSVKKMASPDSPLDDFTFVPGDAMRLTADVSNPEAALPVMVHVAIELFGEYYFWPGYGTMMSGVQFTLPEHLVLMDHVLETIEFDGTFPSGTFTWYGVLANPIDGTWLTDLSAVTWSFAQEVPE